VTKSRTKTATWVGIVLSGILALWFWNSPVLWPVKVLVVLFHELGHAIATWLTGGTVLEIGLSPQVGGHALSSGGNRLAILNAGYLGSLLWGVALLGVARRKGTSRYALGILGAVVFGVALWYVRPFASFGFAFGLIMGAVLMVGGRLLPVTAAQVVLRALGVFSILYALFDVRDDVFYAGSDVVSDATMLAAATGIPSVVWGAAWLVAGVAVLWFTRKWVT
jgi:hypothetical protein